MTQPKQYPKTDSNVAATRIIATKTFAKRELSNASHDMQAATERAAPMPCAKRLGGPGTYFGFQPSLGIAILVTN